MSTDNRKTENTSPRSDKQEKPEEKVADLPTSQTTEQDAQQVKGGGIRRGTNDDGI